MLAHEHPCVRRCCLDDKDVCLGCFRHLDEIKAWSSMNSRQQKAVMNTTEKRRIAYQKRYGATF